MNSLRIKIVLSLIGMSIFSTALGGFYSRLVLLDRFEGVVMARSSDEFARDVASYYRNYGSSFEVAYNTKPWVAHLALINEGRPEKNLEDVNDNTTHFIATDLNGKVWIPNGSYSVGDIVSQNDLSNAMPIKQIATPNSPTIGYVIVEGQLVLTGAEAQYSTDLINSLWVVFFLVALLAAPLGFFLGKRLTHPINILNRAIKAMRPETMNQSVPVTSNDEIGSLSQSFNKMSEELSNYVTVIEQQQKKITETEAMRREGLVSISHELRTPLHRSVAQAYAILDGIRPLEQIEVTKIADSLDHLSGLVNDLHQLSLSDVHAFTCDIQMVDYSTIIHKALETRSDVFAKNNFSLNTSIPDSCIINADPKRLRQIIENLLSNCVRYTTTGGEITISLGVVDNYAKLVVSDNGPGVSPENLEFLFDRFYREESSRSRDTGGSGLGLSLVKTCAEMHGGNVEALQSDQAGLKICVCIPINPTHL